MQVVDNSRDAAGGHSSLDGFIGSKELRALLNNMPARTFWRHVAADRIPRPDLKLGNRDFWRTTSVSAFFDGRCT